MANSRILRSRLLWWQRGYIKYESMIWWQRGYPWDLITRASYY
jgi:hypothetical protein